MCTVCSYVRRWNAQIDRDPGAPSEAKEWEELTECIERLNLVTEWPAIVSIVAGILHLGNIEFQEKGDGSEVTVASRNSVKYAAEMLGFDEERLRLAVTYHTRKIVTGEVTSTPLSPAKAVDSRNGTLSACCEQAPSSLPCTDAAPVVSWMLMSTFARVVGAASSGQEHLWSPVQLAGQAAELDNGQPCAQDALHRCAGHLRL